MKSSLRKLVLLFGCTGKTGFHIANRLLQDSNLSLRVVVRSKTKLQSMFRQSQMAFQSIIEGDIEEETLNVAFQKSTSFGPVCYVISALGASSSKDVENIEHTGMLKIIEASKSHNIQRFFLVSSALMERPFNIIPFFLNTIVPNVLAWKALTENHLRGSGLRYVIIRPPRLIGQAKQIDMEKHENQYLRSYEISQGDTVQGQIHRFTVGQVLYNSLRSNLEKNITFECKQKKGQVVDRKFDLNSLKEDNEENIRKVNAKMFIRARWMYSLICLSVLAVIVYQFVK